MKFARLHPASITLLYAALAAAWIVYSGYALEFSTDDPVLKSRIEMAKGLSFVLATSVVLYLVLRARLRHEGGSADEGSRPGDWRVSIPLLVALALTIPVAGMAVYVVQGRAEQAERLENLAAIADLKASQIEHWLAERRGDGLELAASIGFIGYVKELHRGTNPRSQAVVSARLESLRAVRGYDSITLLDARGQPFFSVGEPLGNPEPATQLAAGAESRDPVQLRGPFPGSSGQSHLNFIVTLALPMGGASERVGTAVMRMNPERFLYPELQVWPIVSATGESNLVRREGDSLVFLNQQRFHRQIDPARRLSLESPEFLAAIAVRAASRGTARGVDYRGVPALGAYRPVAGTDWHVVSKVDLDEALDESRQLAYWVAVIAFFATAITGAALLAYLRQGRRAQKLAMQAETDVLLRHFYRLPFVGMAVTAPETKRWVRFNDRLCEILGYPREELERKSWAELTHPDDLAMDMAEFDRVRRGESDGYAIEKRFIRKDGAVVHSLLDVKCVRKDGGAVDYFLATVQDITERTLHHRRDLRQSRMYAGLSACNAAIGQSHSEDELFKAVCQTAVDSAGLKLAWIGLTDEAGMVRPRTSHGEGEEYLVDLRISVDAQDPYGQGPTGVAIREGRPYWCQDYQNDPRTALWRERAARFRLGASASLPIQRGAGAIGALTVYAEEVNAFDEDARVLLMDMASNMSFALDNFDREAARRRAEAHLIFSEERYRRLVETSPAILYRYSRKRGGIFYSERIEEVLRYSRQHLYAHPFLVGDSIHPEDRAAVSAAHRRLAETGKAFDIEYRIKDAKGEWHWLHDRSTGLVAEEGELVVEGLASDVSNRIRDQDALRGAEEQFRGLVEQAIAGIFIVQDGKYAYVNPRHAEILGYASAEELVGRDPLAIVAEKDRDMVARDLQSLLEGKRRSLACAYAGVRKDGTLVEIGAHVALANHGGRQAIIGLMQDVSEKKRAEERISEYVEQLETSFMHVVEVATNLSEMRDPYTAGHERRVAEIAVAIGTELGLDAKRIEGLRVAGYLHDVGKISIPSEILSKPGRLSAIEYQLIQGHPQSGYDVLKGVDFPWPVAQVALQHHERFDGTGYPQGLKGEAILFEARIVAVADVVEAMNSHRPYRPGLGIAKALAEIERGSGTAYDPLVAGACLAMFREKRFALDL